MFIPTFSVVALTLNTGAEKGLLGGVSGALVLTVKSPLVVKFAVLTVSVTALTRKIALFPVENESIFIAAA